MKDVVSILTKLKTLNNNDFESLKSSEMAFAMSLSSKFSGKKQDNDDDIKKLIYKGILKDISMEVQRCIVILLNHKTYLNDSEIKKHNIIISFLTLYWYSINYSKKYMDEFMEYMELRFTREALNELINEHKKKIKVIDINNKPKNKMIMNIMIEKYKKDFEAMQDEDINDEIFIKNLLLCKTD